MANPIAIGRAFEFLDACNRASLPAIADLARELSRLARAERLEQVAEAADALQRAASEPCASIVQPLSCLTKALESVRRPEDAGRVVSE